ncbi:MAG: ADOP family duplicated permease [Gemmatimonas sp.]
MANVDDELRFHFEQKVAEFEVQGLTAVQARVRADEEFGDLKSVRDSLTEIDGRVAKKQQRAEWWESIAQDFRFVLRSLRRAPIFTATVVVTLALGLGVNASVFTLLDQLYVQPPAGMTNAANVHRLYQTAINRGEPYVRNHYSYKEIRALHSISVEGVSFAGYSLTKTRLGRLSDGPEIEGDYVEGDYFRVAGVGPALGRVLLPAEMHAEGLDAVAVISYSLWQRLYRGDSSIVGQSLDLGSHRFVIVGVAAEHFRGMDMSVSDVWLPLNTIGVWKDRKSDWYEDGNFNGIKGVFRASSGPGATAFNSRATLELRKKDVRLLKDSMSTTALGSINVARGDAYHAKELTISTRLAGVSLVILLIACANVINLMLARSVAREREIAVRLALGVSRGRLLTQLMLESGTLAVLAGAASMIVAYVGTTTLRSLLWPEVQWGAGVIDQRAILFTVGLSLIAGFATGLVPALQASRPSLTKGLKSSVRDGGNNRSRLRASLLIAQAALSVVLIVGAGVFVNSLRSIEAVDFGYSTRNMFFVSVGSDRELSDRRKEIERRLPEVADQLRNYPGVDAVAVSEGTPMYSISWSELHLPGRDSLPQGKGSRDRFFDAVSPTYFATVGKRVEKGRAFADSDVQGGEPVVIVDRYMAEDFWPGEDALTKCVIVGKLDTPCRRVVGVVSPSHHTSIIEDPSQHYYIPLAQAEGLGAAGTIVVKAANAEDMGRVRVAVARQTAVILGDWSRPRTKSMDEIMADDLRPWQVGASLFTIAGILALIVAAVGVYSSLAYTVSQRTQEMGVRVALGASSANIIRLVVGQSVAVVAVGVSCGVLAALALGKVVASMLYETSPHDPAVLIASTLVLLAVAALASSIPAWRAARVDPLTAMRAE